MSDNKTEQTFGRNGRKIVTLILPEIGPNQSLAPVVKPEEPKKLLRRGVRKEPFSPDKSESRKVRMAHDNKNAHQLWAFSTEDMAAALGIRIIELQRMIRAKQFNPLSLTDFLRLWQERQTALTENPDSVDK